MKSKQEIIGALACHNSSMARLSSDPALVKIIAHNLGWSEEYTKGYNEGVKFVYEWVLGKAK
jgi:hypothetical protein